MKATDNLAMLSFYSHLQNQGIAEFQVIDPRGRSRFGLGFLETPPDIIDQVLIRTREQKGLDWIFITVPIRHPEQKDPNLYMADLMESPKICYFPRPRAKIRAGQIYVYSFEIY